MFINLDLGDVVVVFQLINRIHDAHKGGGEVVEKKVSTLFEFWCKESNVEFATLVSVIAIDEDAIE